MEKKLVYLNEPIAPVAVKKLAERYEIVSDYSQIDKIEAIITRKEAVGRDIISRAPNLKIISDHGTGMDQIDLEAAREFGVKVTNTPGLNAESVAELVVGFLLALSFKIKFSDRGMQQGKFKSFGLPELNGNEIYGKKMGFIGSGYIARRTANIMRTAFGAQCFAFNPHRTRDELESLGFCKVDSLEELFSKMDFISVNAPLTDQTRNLVDSKILDGANPNLLLVNTSRGGIINEADLYQALVNKKIRGAALDVFTQEPPDSSNPLLGLDNFVGTLHVGGSTQEALDRVGLATVDNVIDVLG